MTTYVFIHGGNYDSRTWRFVVPHLDGPAVTIDLPGRGRRPADLSQVSVDDFVEAAVEDVEATDASHAVLVAHSAGGLTAAHLLNRMPDQFRAVVLVACTIPPHGTAIVDSIDPDVRDAVLAGSGDGTYVLGEEMARQALCNDLDEEMSIIAMSEMQPDTTAFLSEPADLTALRAHGSVTYVRTLQDETLPAAQQDVAIAASGDCEVVDVDAGHLVMLSQPEALARVIVSAGRPTVEVSA